MPLHNCRTEGIEVIVIVKGNYQTPTLNNSKDGAVHYKSLPYSETSNIANLPSASDLEVQETEEDLLVAQKSHLEYLSGTGRPFEEFLVGENEALNERL